MILEVKDASYSYDGKNYILKDLNLAIKENAIVSVLGQNGVGKTTFLKNLIGLYKWTDGSTFFRGEKVKSLLDKKELAYVAQAQTIALPYRVLDLVLMGRTKYLSAFSSPRKEDEIIACDVLKQVGIYHLKDKKANELSGGQLQMVYLARALAGKPKIIILDEPEAHLDFKNQKIILDKILELAKTNGITCIINTHSPENALKISDYTLFLGKDSYEFGETEKILNEENISKYFGMKSKIVDLNYIGIDKKTFVLID